MSALSTTARALPSDPHVVLDREPVRSLAHYRARGGGEGLRAARTLGPWITAEEVTLSGLRGRGGGGFRTGRKWLSVLDSSRGDEPRFVVANGAEGEPGTFKDRAILRHNPYQVIEGLAITAFVVDAAHAYLALKSTFTVEINAVRAALAEMTAAGLAGETPISIVLGPDSYLFGEEKGLLEVVEGEEPLPRRDPPYLQGLFASGPQAGWYAHEGADAGGDSANPTIVNNIETLATVPHILAHGPEWYRSLGTWDSPGTTVFTVVGDVVRPGYAELELGTPLREVIDAVGGGAHRGRRIKGVFSGVANGVITGDDLDVPTTYEDLRAIGSGLGSAGFIVYDDTADMVAVARVFARFLHVESCGQCGACKLHSGSISETLVRLETGKADDRDVTELGVLLRMVTDQNRCYLPVELQTVVASILRAFPDDVLAHLDEPLAPPSREYPLPKILDMDMARGTVVYDHRIALKQPDWTYAS